MIYTSRNLLTFLFVHVLLLFHLSFADDVSRDDESAPKSASCNNKFQLVSVNSNHSSVLEQLSWICSLSYEEFVRIFDI